MIQYRAKKLNIGYRRYKVQYRCPTACIGLAIDLDESQTTELIAQSKSLKLTVKSLHIAWKGSLINSKNYQLKMQR